MISRKEYMENPRDLHQAYYLEIARDAGLSLSNTLIERCRESTDEHFNDIPLNTWDRAHGFFDGSLSRAFSARGDSLSQSGGVCAAKALAREIIST